VNAGAEEQTTERQEWKEGSAMLFAAMFGLVGASVPLFMIGLLVKPLGAEFGWSRASASAGYLISAFGTLLLSPIVGPLLARLGPRKVALWGVPMVATGIASIGMAGPSIYSWYAAWGLYAVTQAFANVVIWANAIVSRFDRSRGKALALYLTGQALFYGLGPAIGVMILMTFGWRWIFFVIALFNLGIVWPLAWRYFYGARDLDGTRGEAPPRRRATEAGSSFSAMATRQFWQIGIAFAIAAGAVGALQVHLQPIMTDSGLTIEKAALVALIIGPTSVVGRMLSGVFLDLFPANIVACVAVLLPGIPYVLLMFGEISMPAAYICAVFIGFAAGAEADLLAYLVSRYFPERSFGAVYAILVGIYGVGFGTAPIAAGRVFDVTGSYAPIFMGMAGGVVVAALLISSLGRPVRNQGAH
jgi:predicted MFS family arabinose efflux permease